MNTFGAIIAGIIVLCLTALIVVCTVWCIAKIVGNIKKGSNEPQRYDNTNYPTY